MSSAMENFTAHSREIDRLMEIHVSIGGSGAGRRHNLEVLNKSAFVLITAFWEAFCEDLAAEGLEFLVSNASSAEALPMDLRKKIAKELEADTHGLATWKIADGGWRNVLRERMAELTEERNRRLNTPKSAQIDELFQNALGLNRVSSSWRWQGMTITHSRENLDRYVSTRGAIAHRGDTETGIVKDEVLAYQAFIGRLATKTHRAVELFVQDATGKLFSV